MKVLFMMVQIFLFSFSITNLIFDVRKFGFVIRKNSFINLFHKKNHFFVLPGQPRIYARRVFNPQATCFTKEFYEKSTVGYSYIGCFLLKFSEFWVKIIQNTVIYSSVEADMVFPNPLITRRPQVRVLPPLYC